MDLSKVQKIYMIGIKGVGMTMLAQFLAGIGKKIRGSDTEEKFMTDAVLMRSGIEVIEHFSADNVPTDVDLIIYSTAYNAERNVEVAKALAGKIKTLTYAEALAEVFNQRYGIAVIGSHGKTTTTAWLGYVLWKSGLEPNVMVGSRVPQFDGASLTGLSDTLIVEADEYQNKLQYYQPKGILFNNIDYDHPDFFKTKEDYESAFIEFIKKLPKKGFLVANFDDDAIRKAARVNCRGRVLGYSLGSENQEADYQAYDIKSEVGKQFFKVRMNQEDGSCDELGDFSISLSGRHNISNALAVIVAAIELDVELKDIRTYLSEFSGTSRRMEVLGQYHGATIIDDYAHHPTEIKATIAGAKELYGNKKLIVVFHPHTFSRTRELLNGFAQSFDQANKVIILDIYGSAREEQGGVHSLDLVKKAKEHNPNLEIEHIPTLEACERYLRGHLSSGDILLLMGAGDIFRIGQNLVKEVG